MLPQEFLIRNRNGLWPPVLFPALDGTSYLNTFAR